MNFRCLTLGLLVVLSIYTVINLFLQVPFASGFSLLAIFSGIVFIAVLFTDAYRSKTNSFFTPPMVLIGWISSFTSIMAGYASIYLDLVRQDPYHFLGIADGMSAAYFSVVTFATVGFGDIYPVSVTAKLLVMSEIGAAVVLLPITIGTSIAQVITRRLKTPDQNIAKDTQPGHLFRIK
jgi:hypothetical protein